MLYTVHVAHACFPLNVEGRTRGFSLKYRWTVFTYSKASRQRYKKLVYVDIRRFQTLRDREGWKLSYRNVCDIALENDTFLILEIEIGVCGIIFISRIPCTAITSTR